MRKSRDSQRRPKWTFVDTFDVALYQCGLRSGDLLRLRSDFPVTDPNGISTGKIHYAGEALKVLPGSSMSPGIIFLLQADGKECTWPDTSDVFDMFEAVRTEAGNAPKEQAEGPAKPKGQASP